MPFPRSFACVFMYLVNKSFLIGHLLRTRQCAMHEGAAFSEERGSHLELTLSLREAYGK